MELKHLIQRFSYRIEPKAEGGFVAHATDPTISPLEAPTREELQQKIQASLVAAMAEAFPGLKLPAENKQLKFEVHIERKPEGGFAVQAAKPSKPGIEPATQEKIDHFAAGLLGFVDKNFPDLSRALSARIESGVANALAGQETGVILNAAPQPGAQGLPQVQSIQSSYVNVEDGRLGGERTGSLYNSGNAIANTPITPESSSSSTILGFLLTLVIIAAMMYFFLHRR
jgi:hypothetical protein